MNVPSAGTARRWSRLATVALFTPTHPGQPPNGAQSVSANGAPPDDRHVGQAHSTRSTTDPSAKTARRWPRLATVALFTPTHPGQPPNGAQSASASGEPPAKWESTQPCAPAPMNVPSAGTARRWSRLATVALFTPTHPGQPPNGAQSVSANGA